MLTHANLSNAFWVETISTATYVRNRMVTTALKDGETPFQLWYGKKPNLEHLQVFGCAVYIHIRNSERTKLDKKDTKATIHWLYRNSWQLQGME